MEKRTIEAYKTAIKAQYEKAIDGPNSSYLINPSPAQLRELCFDILKQKKNNNDPLAFRNFWDIEFKEENIGAITNRIEITRLIPIKRFYLGTSMPSDMITIEMAALLVDFQERPYREYRKRGSIMPPIIIDLIEWIQQPRTNKMYIIISILIAMVLLVWSLNKTIFTPKNHMVWMEDHYEKIDSNDPEIKGEILPLDEKQLEHFRKVSYSDTLTFFDLYGNPLIWYSKSNGVYELFTYHGLHPVTEKTLKPITYTIINNINSNPNQ